MVPFAPPPGALHFRFMPDETPTDLRTAAEHYRGLVESERSRAKAAPGRYVRIAAEAAADRMEGVAVDLEKIADDIEAGN